MIRCAFIAAAALAASFTTLAQVAPSSADVAAYRGLHAAAARGDVAAIERLAGDVAALGAR